MAYQKFENIEQTFNAHINKRIMTGIVSRDFKNRNCNCKGRNKNQNRNLCYYNSLCRTCCVIYELKCKLCKMKYLGSTQQFLKARTAGHFSDVVKLKNRGISSDAFVAYFTKYLKKYNEKVITKDIRKIKS